MERQNIGGVDVLHWNPRRPIGLRPRRAFRWTRSTPLGPRVDNFGDLLGPHVVRQIVREAALRPSREQRPPEVAVVGSIMHMLPARTVVWGAGVNGKHLQLPLPDSLDVRAVRGPLTRAYLAERGVAAPEVYGDPALLLDLDSIAPVAPETRPATQILHIANLNDGEAPKMPGTVTMAPTSPLAEIIRAIRDSKLVIGSSLHAIIIAEALGVPARAVVSPSEPAFKYLDYYEGTGRSNVSFAPTAGDALEMGGLTSGPVLDPALLAAFPTDLWGSGDAQSPRSSSPHEKDLPR